MPTMHVPAADEQLDEDLWFQHPEVEGSARVFVTPDDRIGIEVDGHALVLTVERWHELGRKTL